jgi:hypothetical protein
MSTKNTHQVAMTVYCKATCISIKVHILKHSKCTFQRCQTMLNCLSQGQVMSSVAVDMTTLHQYLYDYQTLVGVRIDRDKTSVYVFTEDQLYMPHNNRTLKQSIRRAGCRYPNWQKNQHFLKMDEIHPEMDIPYTMLICPVRLTLVHHNTRLENPS